MMEPFKDLAAAIIERAAVDYREGQALIESQQTKIQALKDEIKILDTMGMEVIDLEEDLEVEKQKLGLYQRNANEVLRFLQSEWFGTLCDGLNLDKHYIREGILKSGRFAENRLCNS